MRILFFSLFIFAFIPGVFALDTGLVSHTPAIVHQDEMSVRDTAYVRLLNEQTTELLKQGKTDSAAVLIEEAFSLAKVLNDIEGEAHAAANSARYYDLKGLPDSTVTELEENYRRYEGTGKFTRIGNLLATAHHQLGNFQRSLDLYKEMFEIAVQENDTTMQVGITQNMGNSYGSLGDIPSAIDSYLTSLEMAEQMQDTLIIAVVLDNLASVNTREGNFELAEEYLFRALDLNLEIDHLENQITNHMSLGGLYKDWEKFELSRENYERVLEIAGEIGKVISRIQAIYNLGTLYTDTGENEAAMESFQESLRLSEENNIPIGFYFNNAGMGDLYVNMDEYDQAIESYQQALEVAEMVQGDEMIRATLLNLYEVAEKAGDTLLAYPYLKRYSALTDSLSHTEREEALARQEAMLELRSERQQTDLLEESLAAQRTYLIIISILLGILLLISIWLIVLYRKKQKSNNLLKKRTSELQEANDVKDKLLSVLAHDLRTPISNIQNVVYMIRENMLNKEDLNDALVHIDFQLQQGINTLTNYLEWAQDHRHGISADMENLKLLRPVEDSVHELLKSAENKGVHIQNRVTEDIFVYADKHMVNVILRNLLSNAIKYVNSGDTVTIDAEETTAGVELSVKDTGAGISKDQLKNLFKPFNRVTRGTKGEIGTGLGLSLCKEFSDKQGGSIRCESEIGKGTTFTVTLQKAQKMNNETPIPAGKIGEI